MQWTGWGYCTIRLEAPYIKFWYIDWFIGRSVGLVGWSHIAHFTVMATPTVELVARLPEEQLNGKSKIDHFGSTSAGKFTLPPPIRGRDQLQAMLHRQWLHKVSLSLFPASKCIEIMASLLLLLLLFVCVCVCVLFFYAFPNLPSPTNSSWLLIFSYVHDV